MTEGARVGGHVGVDLREYAGMLANVGAILHEFCGNRSHAMIHYREGLRILLQPPQPEASSATTTTTVMPVSSSPSTSPLLVGSSPQGGSPTQGLIEGMFQYLSKLRSDEEEEDISFREGGDDDDDDGGTLTSRCRRRRRAAAAAAAAAAVAAAASSHHETESKASDHNDDHLYFPPVPGFFDRGLASSVAVTHGGLTASSSSSSSSAPTETAPSTQQTLLPHHLRALPFAFPFRVQLPRDREYQDLDIKCVDPGGSSGVTQEHSSDSPLDAAPSSSLASAQNGSSSNLTLMAEEQTRRFTWDCGSHGRRTRQATAATSETPPKADIPHRSCEEVLLFNMALIHYEWEEYDAALQLFSMSLSLGTAEQQKSLTNLACLNNIGRIHYEAGRLSEAMQSYTDALWRGKSTLDQVAALNVPEVATAAAPSSSAAGTRAAEAEAGRQKQEEEVITSLPAIVVPTVDCNGDCGCSRKGSTNRGVVVVSSSDTKAKKKKRKRKQQALSKKAFKPLDVAATKRAPGNSVVSPMMSLNDSPSTEHMNESRQAQAAAAMASPKNEPGDISLSSTHTDPETAMTRNRGLSRPDKLVTDADTLSERTIRKVPPSSAALARNEQQQQQQSPPPGIRGLYRCIAITLNNISQVYFRVSNFDEALKKCQSAMLIMRCIRTGGKPNGLESGAGYHPQGEDDVDDEDNDLWDTSVFWYNKGLIHQTRGLGGEGQEALRCYHKFLPLAMARWGSDHPIVGATLFHIATLLHQQGMLSKALVAALQSLQIRRVAYGGVNDNQRHPTLAESLYLVGRILQDKEDYRDALVVFDDTLQMQEQVFGGRYNLDVAATLCHVGRIHHVRGDLEKALEANEEVIRISKFLFGDYHPHVASMLNVVGNIQVEQGDVEGAMTNFAQALRITLTTGDNTRQQPQAQAQSNSGDILKVPVTNPLYRIRVCRASAASCA